MLVDSTPATDAAPALAAPGPLDAHADTLDHVVRAVARSDFLPEALRLMLASPGHLHDPELLFRTRGVRGKDDSTLLVCAVERLDVARAAEILDACPMPATRVELLACVDVSGLAALHLACYRDRRDEEAALRMVELLLASGADPLAPGHSPDGRRVHAIHLAAQWSVRLVQRLLQVGASIDGDVDDFSTLCAAAFAGTAHCVRMIPQLVALGARETLGNGAMIRLAQRPVCQGAQPTDGEVVTALSALMSVGCSLTEPDGDGWAPLDWAARKGNAPVVRALLSLGVPSNINSLAWGVSYPKVVRALLAAGAPVDALIDWGGRIRTPLMEAAHESVLESVEVLLAAGASVDLRDDRGVTVLIHSIWGPFDPRVTEALLAAGADVNAQDNEGWTALHWLAARQAQQPWAAGAARLLLQQGADARALDYDCKAPAQCISAAQRGCELHRLLLEATAVGARVVACRVGGRAARRAPGGRQSAPPTPGRRDQPLLDAHADTLDHVVRAMARSDFLPQAVRLMLGSPEHLHDPELLYRTRGVRGAGGTTLLMRAVMRRDVARAAEILGACPTPATRVELLALVDNQEQTALHLACHPDRLDEEAALRMVELLLANGAHLLAPRRHVETGIVVQAIHFAASWSARLVQRLVQAGASVSGHVGNNSTLQTAAFVCTAQGVRMIPQLVALGAREKRGNTAMIRFAGHPVDEGVQPTDSEVVAALKALVSVGCSLTQPDDGWTPLDWAALRGNAPVARALLSLGVPATSGSLANAVQHPEVVRVLLAAGAPVDALVDMGGFISTPLMEAAHASALESVEALLAAGASVDFRGDMHKSALHYHFWGDEFDPRVTEALLAAGADVNARDFLGQTALHDLAGKAQQPWAAGAVRLLLQRGANARAIDRGGSTPAQLVPAAQRGSELHRLLLEAAA